MGQCILHKMQHDQDQGDCGGVSQGNGQHCLDYSGPAFFLQT
jgi:hypothetical protein